MKKQLIAAFILIAYSAILVQVMVFKDVPLIRLGPLRIKFGGTQEGAPNLVPFSTILPYLLGKRGLIIGGINLVGNVILLVPIGFLVPFVYRSMTWKKSLVLAVAAGFVIEEMQVLLHVGIFDIDDVILNGLGVMVGYRLFTILAKMKRSAISKTIIITAVIVIAAAAAFYGVAFYYKSRPVNFTHAAERGRPDSVDSMENKIPLGVDPCKGTGGTGQIVSVGDNTITIRGHNGVNQIIIFTDHTVIRSSTAPAACSDFKIGEGVTVVVPSNHDGSMTATVVLICNASGRKP